MITIKLRFLVGRFHATPWGRHTNEGAVEYPPSVWRLLRSLVAAFYRTRPENVTEENLKRVLVALAAGAPSYYLPSAAEAHTRHYDTANGSLKFFDSFLVMNTDENGANQNSAAENHNAIIWQWRDVELDDADSQALAILLRNLNAFGRSESWCEAELIKSEIDFTPNCELLLLNDEAMFDASLLRGREPVRVLAPHIKVWDADELLQVLNVETSAMRKARQLEPAGASWLTYTRPLNLINNQTFKSSVKTPSPRVTTIRFALGSNVLPLVQDSLTLCELARYAVLKHRKKVDASFSEVLTGKASDETTPLKGHTHAFFIATDEDRDGRVDHLTIHAARGFDLHDFAALAQLQEIYGYGLSHKVFTMLLGAGELRDFSDDDKGNIFDDKRLNIFQTARRWRSVTPFILPRYATRGAGKPPRPRDMPLEQLKREARNRGLPEIISATEIEGYKAKNRNLVRWLDFKPTRLNGSRGYGTAGFEIEFEEDLSIKNLPLALGFGCHFGLGLFEPLEANEKS